MCSLHEGDRFRQGDAGVSKAADPLGASTCLRHQWQRSSEMNGTFVCCAPMEHFGVGSDTGLVALGEEWNDRLPPDWKGELIMQDPATIDTQDSHTGEWRVIIETPKGKKFKLLGIHGPSRAEALVKSGMKKFRKEHCNPSKR